MATTAASYRKPQTSPTPAAAPQKCRTPRRTLAVRIHLSQVARTLDELRALGLVQRFKDEQGVERYRTVRQ